MAVTAPDPQVRRHLLRRLAGLSAGGWVAACRRPDDAALAATPASTTAGTTNAASSGPGASGAAMPGVSPGAPAADGFALFDATAYADKPDLSSFGLRWMPNLTAHRFWPDRKVDDGLPDEALTRAVGAEVVRHGGPVVIDIEHWDLQGSTRSVTRSIGKYVQTLQWLRSAGPMTIGLYGLMPLRDYWRAIQAPDSPAYRSWQKENDALVPILPLIDFHAPSLYAFYDDYEGWRRFAAANIREARRFGKVVYPFLWPQYHEASKARSLDPIEPGFWKLQLQTVREHADGAIVWGGWDINLNVALPWTDEMPWWRETRTFLKTAGLAPAVPTAVK